MAYIHLTQEEGMRLIEQYIFEMTGKRIKANPPQTMVQMQLFHHLAHFVRDYYAQSSED